LGSPGHGRANGVPFERGALVAGTPLASSIADRIHLWRITTMSLTTILLIILILMLLGAVPAWPHSRGWGYYPSGGIGLVLLILIILMLMGRL
jgi:hypothetical protein